MASTLPGLLGLIADIAGNTVAMEIARNYGGTTVSIPPRITSDHWLSQLVGFETADKIARGLATMTAEGTLRGVQKEQIPLGPTSLLAAARGHARNELAKGASARQAAIATGLHERTIWRIKARRNNEDQGELF